MRPPLADLDPVSPQEWLARTGSKDYWGLVEVTGYEYDTVKRWFQRGVKRTVPTETIQKLLAADLELRRLKGV